MHSSVHFDIDDSRIIMKKKHLRLRHSEFKSSYTTMHRNLLFYLAVLLESKTAQFHKHLLIIKIM